ncbi:MAG TPA: Dabb family protein [Pirellulales bacterium]|jgi:hypothetical protein|nr:Dabb family protein [Pirellulales bacterium]
MLRNRFVLILAFVSLVVFGSLAARPLSAAEPEGKAAPAEASSKDSMIAHMVFFTLKDSDNANRTKLIDAAKEYLGGHPGEVYFSVGTMANLKEPVSVSDFDVALHIVFANKAAHDEYLVSPRHLKFIAVAKPLDKSVRVFDSYLVPLHEESQGK